MISSLDRAAVNTAIPIGTQGLNLAEFNAEPPEDLWARVSLISSEKQHCGGANLATLMKHFLGPLPYFLQHIRQSHQVPNTIFTRQ